MPLLDQALSLIPGLKNITTQQPQNPNFQADDFAEGFTIKEYVNGSPRNGSDKPDLVLKGSFMPHQPFTFGGEQHMNTTWYPGNSEPTVQVLGPKEKNLTIKGEFRLKKFKRVYSHGKNDQGIPEMTETQVRQIAVEYQEQLDQMRIRGNLLHIQMGEWKRWGFIQSVSFDVRTLADITYEVEFMISGFTKPLNTKIARGYDDNLKAPNQALIDGALAAISAMSQFPKDIPRSLSDFLNQQISLVAGAIGIVTGFIDDVVGDAEKITASANRAIGLIANARATISSSARRIDAVSTSVSNLGSSVSDQWAKTKVTVQAVGHMHDIKTYYASLASMLAALQAQYASLAKTVPLQRYLVVAGDSLQKISNKFYGTPDHWQEIYDHNKLTSTSLVVGSVLEIPKV
jgi:LysM repeat protein